MRFIRFTRGSHGFSGWAFLLVCLLAAGAAAQPDKPDQPTSSRKDKQYNVLFIISDDLTATALASYGNDIAQTPNLDRLAEQGTRFTRAYCQGTYCGPSRNSFMSGYYAYAIGASGYDPVRDLIGDDVTWPQLFKNHGYYTARVGKIYHMGVPGGIIDGGNGADDPRSWTERFNSPGPEWKAPGDGELLSNNPDGEKPVRGGGTNLVVVEADGGDMVHADGGTAAKAVELIDKHKKKPFWLGVGFVRPHVPFVAPRRYFTPYKPYDKLNLPPKVRGDQDDIPKAGINYKTTANMKLDLRREKKAIMGYYAAVSYMDAQVGKVLDAVERAGIRDETIIIFTSDHGYHLDEHDFWEKVSLHEESARVPMIISVPGEQPAVCDSFVELVDLYPTLAKMCGLKPPDHVQGEDISPMLSDPSYKVRDYAFSWSAGRGGFLLRGDRYAYMQYDADASRGIELYDMARDPKQFHNLADKPEYQDVVQQFKQRMRKKLKKMKADAE